MQLNKLEVPKMLRILTGNSRMGIAVRRKSRKKCRPASQDSAPLSYLSLVLFELHID